MTANPQPCPQKMVTLVSANGLDADVGLTHREAQEIVDRANALLEDFRRISDAKVDDAALKMVVDDFLNKTAHQFLIKEQQGALPNGLRHFDRRALHELVKKSIRINPSPDVSQPLAQEVLVKVSMYLHETELMASADALVSFANRLSEKVSETDSRMRAGWWIFPSRTRSRVYESCEKLERLLESDAGKELEHLHDTSREIAGLNWESTQKELATRPQDFADAFRRVSPHVLGDETGIAGLSDSHASYVESVVHRANDLLEETDKARAISPDIKDVRSALTALLTSWADEIIAETPAKLGKEIDKFYKQEQLRAIIRKLLKVRPSAVNASSSMRRLIMAADRYRLLQKAAESLSREAKTVNDLISHRERAASVKQGLSWLILSDDEKGDALAAVDELARLLGSDRVVHLRQACSNITRVNALGWDIAERDMQESSGEIVSVLKLAAPEVISDVSSVGGLTECMIANADKAVKDVNELLAEVKEAKTVKPRSQPVEDAVDAYRRSKAVTAVASAPIDVLNQGARQFQLRGLKEAGYDTVGSILDVSAYVLENIPGMGHGVAYEAQQMARDYADYQVESARVQLSLDDTSPQMDDLLVALGTYRAMASAQKRIGSSASTINALSRLSEKAESLKPDLVWVLMTRDERQGRLDAGKDLLEHLDGPDVQALQNAVDLALSAGRVDVAQARKDFAQDPVAFAATLEKLVPDAMGGDNGAYGLSDELAEKASAVEFSSVGLKVTLRPYQVWGVKFALAQKRVLLGDEMGLGKTIQALAVMAALHAMGYRRFMVVCPLSVLENWDREVKVKSDFIPIKIYGQDRESQYRLWRRSLRRVAITTYETLARLDTGNLSIDFLVVDEAHYAKNPEAKRTKNLMRFVSVSNYILFMTGTALENKSQEMVQLIKMLQPDVARRAMPLVSRPFGDSYRNAIAPVYYRRKREDVLDELPELTETEEWCRLSEDEVPAYVTALRQSFMSARRVSWNVGDLSKSRKARRLEEIVELAREDGRKVLIFSYFRQTLTDIAQFLGPEHCIGPINGSISPQNRQRMVDRFENASAGTALVAQIQAGGTGLNIQAASVVILCEPQFKPSIENQAISRAYRMGQTRKVFVHRLLCKDTIDERIMEILAKKQRIFDAFADKSVAAEQVNQTFSRETMDEIVRDELRKYADMVEEGRLHRNGRGV